MTKALTLGVLAAFLFAGSLAACSDVGEPNDVINAQENSRLDRGMPSPTELPPNH